MPSSHRANCTAPALGLPITEEPHPSSHAPRFGFSPIQVATHADHSFASGLQTYITFEGRARPAPLAVWPFGAPVLFLRCCHGRFCFAPTYPSVPPDTHTYTLTLGTHTPQQTRTAYCPRSLDRLQSFLMTIGRDACQSYRSQKPGLS